MRGADERQRLDVRVIADHVGHFRTAMNDVEHARRHTCFMREFHEAHGRAGVLFRRLENEGVAAGNGHREHEAGQHHGEVEGRDTSAHANRLQQVVDIHASGCILCNLSELQGGDRAGMLHHFKAAAYFAFRIGQRFAVFAGDELREFCSVLADQMLQLEHHTHARAERCFAPCLEGFHRIGNGQLNLFACGEGNAGHDFLRGRVGDITPFRAFRCVRLAANEVVNRSWSAHVCLEGVLGFIRNP